MAQARRKTSEHAVEGRGELCELVVGLPDVESMVEVVLAPLGGLGGHLGDRAKRARRPPAGWRPRPAAERRRHRAARRSRAFEAECSYGSSEMAETTVPTRLPPARSAPRTAECPPWSPRHGPWARRPGSPQAAGSRAGRPGARRRAAAVDPDLSVGSGTIGALLHLHGAVPDADPLERRRRPRLQHAIRVRVQIRAQQQVEAGGRATARVMAAATVTRIVSRVLRLKRLIRACSRRRARSRSSPRWAACELLPQPAEVDVERVVVDDRPVGPARAISSRRRTASPGRPTSAPSSRNSVGVSGTVRLARDDRVDRRVEPQVARDHGRPSCRPSGAAAPAAARPARRTRTAWSGSRRRRR